MREREPAIVRDQIVLSCIVIALLAESTAVTAIVFAALITTNTMRREKKPLDLY
jgi:hypothetical protein